MYTDAFNAIISDLGKLINIPNLSINDRGQCIIRYPRADIRVELSTDPSFSHLQLFCQLGDLQHGRYQEEVLQEALQANHLSHPRFGNFGYSTANNQLVLWEVFLLKEIDANALAEYLKKFVPKAAEVKEAIKNNTVPSLTSKASVRTSGIFGMIR